MGFPLANATVTVRGTRTDPSTKRPKQYYARDIEVHIYPARVDLQLYAGLADSPAARYKYAMHWDPEDQLLDAEGSEVGDIGEGDILLWENFQNQELALSAVTWNALDDEGGFVLYTAYFAPVAQGEGTSG